jgi:phosphatidylserine decarboxylase
MKPSWLILTGPFLTAILFVFLLGLLFFIYDLGTWALSCWGIALGCGILILVFFRDPERSSVTSPQTIVAPADGRIVACDFVDEPIFMHGPAQRIAIFMHLGNVHVQRIPSPGYLEWIQFVPGKFRVALDPRAHVDNQRQLFAFTSPYGPYLVVQITGAIARRTLTWIQPQQHYERGIRLGMIVLGSEVDLYLPLDVKLAVKPGQAVRAGETILGEWPHEKL